MQVARCCGDNGEANAAFIVRAVNAHDALVSAIESGIASLEQLVNVGRIPANNAGLRDLRAALKLARGDA